MAGLFCYWSRGLLRPIRATACFWIALTLAGACAAQTAKTASGEPAFEVVSLKYAGSPQDHMSARSGGGYNMTWRPLEYKGNRLTGDAALGQYVEFACSPLLSPVRYDFDDPTRFRYYQIDAIAPPGATLDQVRAMLRSVLAERLGFKYHLTDRQTSVYFLERGTGAIKLTPATEPDPKGGSLQSTWLLDVKSQPVSSLARFLSSVVGQDVIDKTGIQGEYRFHLDWRQDLQEHGMQVGLSVAIAGMKSLGLKLEQGKEMRKFLVIDHINLMPTPN